METTTNLTKPQAKQKELANQYKGTRYEDLIKANPYISYDYELGIWDRIGNAFGFRTSEDQRREEMAQAAEEYNAQVASLKSEDQYNTPQAQAARMRAAGQNPDLLGTQGVAEAGEFNEPETTPAVPGMEQDKEALQMIANFGGNVMNIGTVALGLAKNFNELLETRNNIERGNLENADKYIQHARNFFLEYIKPEDFGKAQDRKKEQKNNNLTVYYDEQGDEYAKLHFRSSIGRKKFKRALQMVERSLPTSVEAYKKWQEREKTRTEYAKTTASAGWSEDDEQMAKFWQAIIQPLEEVDRIKNGLEKDIYTKLENWKDKDGVTYTDYVAAGKGEEAKTKWQEENNKQTRIRVQNSLNNAWDKILKNADDMIKSKDQKEHFWGWLIKVAIMYIRTAGAKIE